VLCFRISSHKNTDFTEINNVEWFIVFKIFTESVT
jgi:hypothetical protein